MPLSSDIPQTLQTWWSDFIIALRFQFKWESQTMHTEKYYSQNSYLGPEEMPLNKNPVGSTVFHANFIASVADTARIFYLK